MDPVVPGQPAAPGWMLIDLGSAMVAVVERDALGTSARVAVWPPYQLARVLAVVDAELTLLDRQASRFREDSEISAIHRSGAGVHRSPWATIATSPRCHKAGTRRWC